MPTETTLIKLFVSSPGDVAKEREYVDVVVNELNRGVCRNLEARIEVIKWDTDVVPGMGRPQKLVNEQIGNYDIFLGIMWKRFGTPTGVAESGTEEEFNHAYSLWEKHNDLHILFYFSQERFYPKTEDEIHQFEKVHKFHKRLYTVGLVAEYEGADTFPNIVRPHLTNLITDILKEHRKQDTSATVDIEDPSVDHEDSLQFPIETLPPGQSQEMQLPFADDIYSSFKSEGVKSRFLRQRVPTTPGYDKDHKEWRESSIYIMRDPIRPYLIQIGETRSQRKLGNPEVLPELLHLDLVALREMYPFMSKSSFKWIRMVIAELSTKPDVLDYIYRYDPEQDVRITAAKNPSASVDLMTKECPFCNANFNFDRRIQEKDSESDLTRIIRNDFPYGPNFHYMAVPRKPIHSWQEFTEDLLCDLNLLLLKFLKNKLSKKAIGSSLLQHIEGAPGVHIGFNSTIRHLILTKKTRASAGASIPHVHKQFWGMTDGTVNLSEYLTRICKFSPNDFDYLNDYLETLERKGFVIWDDNNVALYVPIGQMSIHELQVIVKREDVKNYLALNEDEVKSLSKAEYLVVQIFEKLGISSFNEVILTEDLNSNTKTFRLIMTFITREVDLAVSELNHLFVVDKHPYDTVKAIVPILSSIEKSTGIMRNRFFACFLNALDQQNKPGQA